jgi:hypothetical protein
VKKIKQQLSGIFLAAAVAIGSILPQAAMAQNFRYHRLGNANIVIPITNLNVTNSEISFVINKRRINILSFLSARTGQLYSGDRDASRLCPVFEVATHSFTRTDNGHLRTVRARVNAAEASEIRRRGCVTLPDMKNLPR